MLLDKDIREPLFEFLEEKLGKVRFLEEKMMGRSRADVIMITEDEICGIEIKSDADSYARLKRQVPDYCIYFDKNYVVVGSTHGAHVSEHVPEDWGIITVEETADGNGAADFYILREALPNPACDPARKITILWRPELVHIQELNSLPAYKTKSKAFVQQVIMDRVPYEIWQKQMCEELLQRDYTTIHEEINAFRTENGMKKRIRKKRRKRRSLI
ncbi:MAG: sce7726 family protein [Lachnospiraceae bacterium]|nr:sce7726 family protein [Lachnospiraceae bacterium]MCR5267630.1 sce7726 family protein [Lachnospiraceae bacterium]